MIVTNRDDLVECSVMLTEAKKHHIDTFSIPHNALDVLAQHLVGMSQNKRWDVDSAYAMVRTAYPLHHTLDKKDFIALLEYLSGMYVGLESRRVYAKLWYDEKENAFGRRGKLTKLIYFLNIGTIPDEVAIDVVTKENKWIGSIQEEFLSRLKPGDMFALGGKIFRFDYARIMKCYVTEAPGQVPTIPPWYSEQLPLTYELAIEIGRFREQMAKAVTAGKIKTSSIAKLMAHTMKPNKESLAVLDTMPIDDYAKSSIFIYFAEQLLYTKVIPNDRLLLVEKSVSDDGEKSLIIFHALYGRRIIDALSRVFALLLAARTNSDVGINISDVGFVLAVPIENKPTKKDIEEIIIEASTSDTVRMLKANIRRTEMMKRRFRYNAARSFMILRNYKGIKIGVRKQHVNAQAILKLAEEISPNFPIIKETYREIFEDVMDLPRANALLKRISKGEVAYKIIETGIPRRSHT